MNILTNTETSLQRLQEKLSSCNEIGLDFETTSSHPDEKSPLQFDKWAVVGYGIGFPDEDRTYIPIAHESKDNLPQQQALDLLIRICADPKKKIWAHNVRFEKMVCRSLGIDWLSEWRCSMIAQWLLNKRLPGAGGLKLKPSVKKYLKYDMLTWEEVVPKKCRAHQILPDTMAPYCSDDALQCLLLGKKFFAEMDELKLRTAFLNLEMPFTDVLIHMEEVGFNIDSKYLQSLYLEFNEKLNDISSKFSQLDLGVSITSDQAISKLMIDELKLWPIPNGFERGKSGVYSIDREHRSAIRNMLEQEKGGIGLEALNLKEEYQSLSTITNTFTHKIAARCSRYRDGRLRCNWKQTKADTGRLASSDPNFQNLPFRSDEGRKVRKAFSCEEGWTLYDADYKGADLRMMAHLSKDENMMDVFENDRDLHQETADRCNCDRFTGKTLNLGLIYEMSEWKAAKQLGISVEEARIICEKWHATYPKVRRYHSRMHAYARKYGFVRTITGRIRKIDGINSKSPTTMRNAERAASNSPDQGSVADIIKIAMRDLIKEWKDRGVLYDWYTGEGKAKLVSQIHDELIVELRDDFKEEGADDVKRHMEQAVELRVPMKTDGGFGKNWLEAH